MYKELSVKTIAIILAVVLCVLGIIGYIAAEKPEKTSTTSSITTSTTKTTTTKTTTSKTPSTTTTSTQAEITVADMLVGHKFVDSRNSSHYYVFAKDGSVTETFSGANYSGKWSLNNDSTILTIHDDLTNSDKPFGLTFDHSGVLFSFSYNADTFNAV